MELMSILLDCNYKESENVSNITNCLNKIKTAIYGKDVRGAIHDAIKQVYDDASVNHDNANMEVKMARGTHNTLNDRLDKSDEIQAQTNAQLSLIRNNVVVYSEDFRYSNSVMNDDATTLSLAIDFLKNGGKLIINGNYDCDLVINHSNIIIEGYSGGITGTVNIVGELNNRTQYVELRNLNIINRDSDFTNVGVKLEFAERVTIRGCRIRGYDKSIYVPVRDTFQHVNRLMIYDNIIERCNYCLYLDMGSLRFESGDVHFKNNQCYAGIQISHIYARTVDGIVIEGNTLFFPGSDDRNMTKTYNIRIMNADWVIIDGNNLFEAGEDAIYVRHSRDVIISNNHIAWPGQVVPSCGIKVAGGYFENNYNITGNTVVRPTKCGIHIWDNNGNDVVKKASVTNNHVIELGDDSKYYGTTDLNTVTKYAIANDNNNLDVLVVGNNCAGFPLGVNNAVSKNNLTDTFEQQLQLTQLYSGTHNTVSDLSLNHDITRYSMLFVSYGAVGAGTFQTEIVRPYHGDSTFKAGNKFTVGNNDKIIFSIKDATTLSVEQIGAVHLREISAIFTKTIQ